LPVSFSYLLLEDPDELLDLDELPEDLEELELLLLLAEELLELELEERYELLLLDRLLLLLLGLLYVLLLRALLVLDFPLDFEDL
jgi:hypothetical protein